MRTDKPWRRQHEILEDLSSQVDPQLMQESRERAGRTVDYVVRLARELGLEEKLFLIGGWVNVARNIGAKRPHKDVDFFIQHGEAAQKLFEALVASGVYKPVAWSSHQLGGPVYQLESLDPALGSIDLLAANPAESNGVLVYGFQYPEALVVEYFGETVDVQRPTPASAFSEKTVTLGQEPVRYVHPEWVFLLLATSVSERRRADRVIQILNKQLDLNLLKKIKDDFIQATGDPLMSRQFTHERELIRYIWDTLGRIREIGESASSSEEPLEE